jgi:hypothetical protein
VVNKNGSLGEGVSLKLNRTFNERATLYLAKIKNITLVDGVIEKMVGVEERAQMWSV